MIKLSAVATTERADRELNEIHRLSSQAYKRLHDPSDDALQLEVPLHCNETDAVSARRDDRLVIDGLITQVEIARSIIVAILAEGAG